MFQPTTLAYLNVDEEIEYSGPKRDVGGNILHSIPDSFSFVYLVAFFDSFPVELVHRIILNDNDPMLYEQIYRLSETLPDKKREDVLSSLRRAFDNDLFWKQWVTTCFFNISSKPENVPTWKIFAAVIVKMIESVTVTTRGESMSYVESIDERDLYLMPPLAKWREFILRKNEMVTCSQLYNWTYRFTEVIENGDEKGSRDLWTPATPPNALLVKPFDVIYTDHGSLTTFDNGNTTGLVFDGISFTREMGPYTVRSTDIDDYDEFDPSGWDSRKHIIEYRTYQDMTCSIFINPVDFISNNTINEGNVLESIGRYAQILQNQMTS